jgi:hypothetical protein
VENNKGASLMSMGRGDTTIRKVKEQLEIERHEAECDVSKLKS